MAANKPTVLIDIEFYTESGEQQPKYSVQYGKGKATIVIPVSASPEGEGDKIDRIAFYTKHLKKLLVKLDTAIEENRVQWRERFHKT